MAIYTKNKKHYILYVHCSLYSSQDVETLTHIYLYICVCVCVCVYTHIMDYYSVIKWWNLGICNSVDRTWGYYARWNKSDIEKQCIMLLLFWNIKNFKNKWVNETKPKQTHRYREQINGYHREVGRRAGEMGKEVQLYSDKEKLHFRWWACCRVCRSQNIMFYTWNASVNSVIQSCSTLCDTMDCCMKFI